LKVERPNHDRQNHVHDPFTIECQFAGRKTHREEQIMENEKPTIRIELTEEQKKAIKEASGEEISVIEFTPQELEDRIAPIRLFE
jgi:hypothetical protein